MPRAPSLNLRWWAQRWLDPLESLAPELSGRLSRARSYARNHHVWQLSARPGLLSAQVLGSYGYYTAIVQAPPNPDAVWERMETALAEQPALLASLLADDLPSEVELLFNDAGGSLFYGDPELLRFQCTCPDWQRPCKHALAVCYDFAAQASARPGLLIELAGRTLEQLAEALAARWAVDDPDRAAIPLPVDDRPLRAAGFYTAGPSLDALIIPFETPAINAALLLQLGKPPFASDAEDPLTPLSNFYATMTEQALRTLAKSRHMVAAPLPASAIEQRGDGAADIADDEAP
ncbi:MAG TPA: SWIM zinc finger family protein [Ktedonobacterales bacterium]